MYMIKSCKNFLIDFVVEQNLTCPKDAFWRYLNRLGEISCSRLERPDDCEYGSLVPSLT